MVKDGRLEWMLPYQPGKLTATAYRDGQPVATAEVATTGAGAGVALSADKTDLKPDGTDIAVVWVNVADAAGKIVPTAGDLVGFEVSGPIRIIGVGNGDPGSHEPDRPADRHTFVPLSGWRTLAVDSADHPAARTASVDTSSWRDPAAWLPPTAQPPLTPYLVLRGEFPRPAMAADGRAALFIDRLDAGQAVYVNGRAVEAAPVDGGLMIALEGAQLKETNILAYVVATPRDGVQGMFDRSVGTSKWGVLRATAPAAPWQRRVFNGWAQVIVQSTGQAGEAGLTAKAPGLAPATIRFQSGQAAR